VPVRQQRGAAMVLVLVGMVALLAMVGLAIEVSHLTSNKARLQSTVDAAALAGAKVLDQTGSQPQASSAALAVFRLNATAYPELSRAIDNGLNIRVQFLPNSAVRAVATNFSMSTGFTAIVGFNNARVAASAVAGPSPMLAEACNIAPIVVCGTPGAPAPFFGYSPNALQVLKMASTGGTGGPIGPGNFQLIRLNGNGGATVRENLAGGYSGCLSANSTVVTQAGNLAGPVAQGLNTRFGMYSGGGMNQAEYPPDVVTIEPNPRLEYNDAAQQIMQGARVVTTSADINFNYQNYLTRISAQSYDYQPMPNGPAAFLRRELTVPVANCAGANSGISTLPVLGFACYFLLQRAEQQGLNGNVYGQFIEGCQSQGVPGPFAGSGSGPHSIQLYNDEGSPDS